MGTAQIDDPASLKKAGNNANELAGRLNADGKHAEDDTAHAVKALKGEHWHGALGSTLDAVLDTWSRQTASLVRKCRDIHSKCTATADNYTRTERENTAVFSTTTKQSPFG
ncbi:type VII secretion target [Streptomyces sp. NPDC059637]|uniref:WXG100 family type VII secretion target n=1 Tax=Streptomyces TaxID=1883 RepID=UPI0031DC92D4